MPTNIKQIEDKERSRTILRIQGSMEFDDAVLLKKIVTEMLSETDKPVTLDLADLDFLDSESATVLYKLKHELNIDIEGLEIFLQRIINETERK